MILDDVVLFAKGNTSMAILFTIIAIGAIVLLLKRFPVFGTYGLIILVALGISNETGKIEYFFAFMLGMVTAFAEIISKFRDEPLKAFRTMEAAAYHTLNGCISVFALYVMEISGVAWTEPLDKVNAVVVAGLGSMLIMRSRLFNVKVGNEEMAFGPEQIIKIYFRFMERAIDRERAQSRIEFVRRVMANVDFKAVYEYTSTMLDSAQVLEEKRKDRIKNDLKKISDDGPKDSQLKSYKMGFLLLNEMGEKFLEKLFGDQAKRKLPKNWAIDPRAVRESSAGWNPLTWLGQESKGSDDAESNQYLYYPVFFYGELMDEDKLEEKLDGKGIRTKQRMDILESARPATLANYKLTFNTPLLANGVTQGGPNIEKSDSDSVYGVLYRLPEIVFDHFKPGYRMVRVQPVGSGLGSVRAHAFVAEKSGENLVTCEEVLGFMVRGARTHKFPKKYVAELEKQKRQTPGTRSAAEHTTHAAD